ncbi:hypothetical protein TI39_contig4195g00012 [Zymoseptoria brevis]|uniref:Uncharacterized protein n=1 Tax=Zymoseptoria brevis TaxID=1047168 RepID=A0A0F4GAM3_9PEZI|nr:hypothetical protein TI39_contig4195g00012 [Zymoseptoria brevis]
MPCRPQKGPAAFQQSASSATEPNADDEIELHLNSLPSTYGCPAGAADRGGHFDAGGLVKIGAWLGDLSDETMSVNGMLSFAEVKKSHFDQITAGADPNEVEPHVLAEPQLPVWTLAAWFGPPNARREVLALLEKVPTGEAGLNESTDPLWRFWKSGGGYTNETTLAEAEPGTFSKRALSRMRVHQPDAENEWDEDDPLAGPIRDRKRPKRKRAENGSKGHTTPSRSSRGKKRSRTAVDEGLPRTLVRASMIEIPMILIATTSPRSASSDNLSSLGPPETTRTMALYQQEETSGRYRPLRPESLVQLCLRLSDRSHLRGDDIHAL